MVLKEKYKCLECNRECEYRFAKELCPKDATSIICSESLLSESTRLTQIYPNAQNKYFLIIGTNTVIMMVESEFCILIDYQQYIDRIGTIGVIPYELINTKYTMQRINNRDWTIKSGKGTRIAYDVQEIIHSKQKVGIWKDHKYSVDHSCETYDERAAHTYLTHHNPTDKSHRVRVELNSQNDLNDFIDDIFTAEKQNDGVYYDLISKNKYRLGWKKKKRDFRTTRGRKFVIIVKK